MKKTIIASLFLALASYAPTYALTANHLNPEPVKILVKTKLINDKVFELRLANLEQKYTYLELSDLQGKKIYYSEGINRHNGYVKAINIESLADGLYALKIKSKGKTQKQVIQVKGNHVYFSTIK